MTKIMPVPRNLILLSYQQRARALSFFSEKRARFTNARPLVVQILFTAGF